jgi:PAS domain S-box-containing protein
MVLAGERENLMAERINLLLVEDNKVDAFLIVHELKNSGFEVTFERVQTEAELQAALEKSEWDAVLSDFSLPMFSAPDALETLRQSGQDLPFIVVSGAIGEETAVKMMRAGAHDYLMKDNLSRLAEVLRREIREAHMRRERRQTEVALQASEERFRLLFERSSDAIFLLDTRTGRYLDGNVAAEILTGRSIAALKTLSTTDVSPKDTEKRLKQAAGAQAVIEFGEVIYNRPDGSSRVALLSTIPVGDNLAFGIARDITAKKQAEEALKRHAQELEALYSTSLKINAQTELLPLLQMLVDQAVSLLGAKIGGLYLVQPDGATLKLVVAHNLPEAFLGITLQLGEGLVGRIALTNEPMMISDYSAWEGRAAVYADALFKRVLGVPMRVKERVVGVIDVTDDVLTSAYTADEVRLLNLFADQAAIAVENARLLEALQQELSERKQVEIALRESEARYRNVVTDAPVVSFVFDANGVFTLSEGKGLANLNLTPGEVVGKSVFDIYRAYPAILTSVKRALAGEAVRSEDVVGSAIFDTFYTPLLADGKVMAVVGVATDITERKQAEESLRSTKTFLDQVVRAVPLGISVYNLRTRKMEFANEINTNFSGLTMEQFNAADPGVLWEMVHPDDRQRRQDFMRTLPALEDGQSREIEFRRLGHQGEWHWYNYRYFAFERETDGTISKLLTVTEDVTERKRADLALARQLQELKLLHNLAMAGIQTNTLDDLVGFVTHEVGQSFHLDAFGVLLFSETGHELRLHPSYHGLVEHMPEALPLENSISGRVATTGQPYRVGNVAADPLYLKAVADIRSELCVPIKTGEKILGAIDAESRHLDYFTEDDERLLLTIAGQMAIAIERIRLFNGLQTSLMNLNQAYDSTIEGWSRAMDLRDKDTEGHTLRVTELTLQLAAAMGIGQAELLHIRRGALLHDIGKIGVPDPILLKPDGLTVEEWTIMRRHPQYAYDMIAPINYLVPALDIPYCHHERWDGNGYPRGLRGAEIPLAARIFAVVDVWDALTSDRPYRAAWSFEATLTYIRGLAGTQFDPQVVQEFMKLMGK